jgi:hypothetical protein
MVKRVCTTSTDFFYVQGFTCQASCTGLLTDSTNKLCLNCDSVCDGCTTDIGNCFNCKSGNHRIKDIAAPYPNCVCDKPNGYV